MTDDRILCLLREARPMLAKAEEFIAFHATYSTPQSPARGKALTAESNMRCALSRIDEALRAAREAIGDQHAD